VVSGIIYVIRHGLQWRDAPAAYGPHKTLYNRFVRWSRLGVFDRIFAALAAEGGPPERLMIDSTHLKAHRTVGCCRFDGHEDEIVTHDPESGYDETEVQPRVQD
jgi:transposase